MMSDTGSNDADNEGSRQSKRPSRFKEIASKLDNQSELRSDTQEESQSDDFGDQNKTSQARERNIGENHNPETAPTTDHAEPDAIESRTVDNESDRTDGLWEWVTSDETIDSDSKTSRKVERQTDPPTESSEPKSSREHIEDNPREELTDEEGESTNGESDIQSAVDDLNDPTATGSETSTSRGKQELKPSRAQRRNRAVASDRIWDRDASQSDEPQSNAAATDVAAVDNRISHEIVDDPSRSQTTDDSLDGLDLTPGTSVLVQSGSQDDRTESVCHKLLHAGSAAPYVLLIRYRELDPDRLKRIASHSQQTKLIAIGYTQSSPASCDADIECVNINNPNDTTRFGMLVSETVDDWADNDHEIAICYDSLNVLLNYKDVKSTFRFLHVFLNILGKADTVTHFHVDPLAGNPQEINNVKPLFDEVVSIDSVGVNLE
jgi:hypothetical protein